MVKIKEKIILPEKEIKLIRPLLQVLEATNLLDSQLKRSRRIKVVVKVEKSIENMTFEPVTVDCCISASGGLKKNFT